MDIVYVVDTREQKPYKFDRMVKKKLNVGDYSIKGFENKFAVERKSLADWVGSITKGRKRFEKELKKGKELDYFAVIIETNLDAIWYARLFSKISRASIVNTIYFWQMKYNFPFCLVSDRSNGKYVIKQMARAYMKYKAI